MLKKNAKFVRMEDAGRFMLPREARVVHAGIAKEIKPGDFIKFTVESKGHVEKFWTTFVSHNEENQTVDVVVNNDMVYTNQHGLEDGMKLTIEEQFICAVLGNL